MHRNPEAWIAHVFSSKAARTGGVVRRSVAWVDREIGRDEFLFAVAQRGFRLLECGGQIVVICTRDRVKILL